MWQSARSNLSVFDWEGGSAQEQYAMALRTMAAAIVVAVVIKKG